MYVQKARYLWLDAVQVWWPESVADVTPYFDQTPVVILWQCPIPLVEPLRRWTFRNRPFQTPLIDLTRTEEDLWQRMHRSSCRKEIRRALEMDLVVTRNEQTETARLLINQSIRRQQYRNEISPSAWQALLPDHDVFMIRSAETPLAAHVMLLDRPKRARGILSGTADRTEAQVRGIVGHANRLLHWREIQHYKAEGFRFFDFGGIELDEDSSEPNPHFKLSFGGEVVHEPMLYLSRNPALRLSLRAISSARSALRRVPWPESWLKTLRARPKFLSWFR